MDYKRHLILIIFLLSIVYTSFSQSNRRVGERGELLWQYHQSAQIDAQNPNSILVTLVIVNGKYQTAFKLRQELFKSKIEWLETENAEIGLDGKVCFITANIKPEQASVWKYRISNYKKEKEILLEKSAILIMNESFEVIKEIFPERVIKM